MKIVLQRVDRAGVAVFGEQVGSIGKGLIAFLGIAEGDTKQQIERVVDKIAKLRIFADQNGKTNLSSKDVEGEIMVISQFTLMADCHSNRPSFSRAAKQDIAKELYEYFIELCSDRFKKVACGRFGEHMHISADNDGPFTLVLE